MQTDTPPCYYHPQQHITNFCLHSKCILPLCEKCLQIHRQNNQSVTGEHISKIFKYQQVRQIAVESIGEQLDKIENARIKFVNKFEQFKNDLLENMVKVLKQIEEDILSNWGIDAKQNKLMENRTRIMNGSLKQIISHYQNGNYFKQSNAFEAFNYHINAQHLKNHIITTCLIEKDFIDECSAYDTDEGLSHSEIQEYRNSEVENFCKRQFPSSSLEILNDSKGKNLHLENIMDEKNQRSSQGSRKNIFGERSSSKKRSLGIFVASSPKFEQKFLKEEIKKQSMKAKRSKSKFFDQKTSHQQKISQIYQEENYNQRQQSKRSTHTANNSTSNDANMRRCNSQCKVFNQNISFMDANTFSQNAELPKKQSSGRIKTQSTFDEIGIKRLQKVSVPITVIPQKASITKIIQPAQNKLVIEGEGSWKKVVKMQRGNEGHRNNTIEDIQVKQFKVCESSMNMNMKQSQSASKLNKVRIVAECCKNGKMESMMSEIMSPQEMRDMILKKRSKNLKIDPQNENKENHL